MAKTAKKAAKTAQKDKKFARLYKFLGIGGFLALLVLNVTGMVVVMEAARIDEDASFRHELRTAVETITKNVNTIYAEYQSGDMTYGNARELAIRMVNNATWNDARRGFWALEYDGTLLSKVENGDVEQKPGENVWNWQDADGRYVEQEFIAAAQAGGGYVEFRVDNDAVKNSYVGYALPNNFNFMVDATYDVEYFEKHWGSQTVISTARYSVIMTVAVMAIIAAMIGFRIVRFRGEKC
jgi:signal transduction histidine kinase